MQSSAVLNGHVRDTAVRSDPLRLREQGFGDTAEKMFAGMRAGAAQTRNVFVLRWKTDRKRGGSWIAVKLWRVGDRFLEVATPQRRPESPRSFTAPATTP